MSSKTRAASSKAKPASKVEDEPVLKRKAAAVTTSKSPAPSKPVPFNSKEPKILASSANSKPPAKKNKAAKVPNKKKRKDDDDDDEKKEEELELEEEPDDDDDVNFDSLGDIDEDEGLKDSDVEFDEEEEKGSRYIILRHTKILRKGMKMIHGKLRRCI